MTNRLIVAALLPSHASGINCQDVAIGSVHNNTSPVSSLATSEAELQRAQCKIFLSKVLFIIIGT